MNRHTVLSTFTRALVAVACLVASASCGGEMLRTGRSPVFLVLTNLQGLAGSGGTPSQFLLSDVQVLVEKTINGVVTQVPTYYNDVGTATFRVEAKNPTVETTGINAVTITRYRVVFRRSDGRNTPGVDVPYGFDGAATTTISAGGTGSVAFDLIRHQAKLEPPLRNLVQFGGVGFISTIVEITFYGHDQNGNEMVATGSMDVQFGDFADEE
jgi:hypothetical protein